MRLKKLPIRRKMPMDLPYIEKLFREEVGLDIKEHKDKGEAISETVVEIYEELLRKGIENANYNGRDYVSYNDLPITEDLERNINRFIQDRGEEVLKAFVDYLAELEEELLKVQEALPPLDEELHKKKGDILGGIMLTFAEVAKMINGERKLYAETIPVTREVLRSMI